MTLHLPHVRKCPKCGNKMVWLVTRRLVEMPDGSKVPHDPNAIEHPGRRAFSRLLKNAAAENGAFVGVQTRRQGIVCAPCAKKG